MQSCDGISAGEYTRFFGHPHDLELHVYSF
jgi:hypothetical protein